MINLREALTRATDQLAVNPHLAPTALPDAALLLEHTLQITRATLRAHPERLLTREDLAAYQAAITRRLAFEPIQYILGTQEFYGLALKVTPAVLIPRPETELLVETVLHHFQAMTEAVPHPQTVPHSTQPHRDEWGRHPLRIADIGTGSGAIAIALAHHLPQARITALDLSPEALAIAEQNAHTHSLHHRIRFLQSDLLEAVAHDPPFDAVVSNPPYVPHAERDSLHPQVRDHEPHQALFADDGGLALYRRLIPQARLLLKPDGLLALEFGHGQHHAIAQLLADWQQVHILNDLNQIPRVALARR